MEPDLGPLLKAIYPKVVATLVRVLGDIDRAMDASQDALVKALQSWHKEGVPENPVAWLVTVGRNGAIDQLRREQRVVSYDSNVVSLHGAETQTPVAASHVLDAPDIEALDWLEVDDDLLRLMFTCCHPTLRPNAQIVLILKVVLGFTVEEIARGLLASPASVEKRITRAKAKLKEEDVAYAVPAIEDIPERRQAVLKAVYLLFNEGYTRIQNDQLVRGSLIDVAIRLGRITARLFRHDPEPRALLALMLLSTARLPSRVDREGCFVPLAQQDRSLWDQTMIGEGQALLDAVYAARHLPGAYQIQATISLLHCQAAQAADTDWPQIAALYLKLEDYDASPVVPVNRAVALSFSGHHQDALELLLDEQRQAKLSSYQPYFAALGHVYQASGNLGAARVALHRALELAQSPAQKRYLERCLVEVSADDTPSPKQP